MVQFIEHCKINLQIFAFGTRVSPYQFFHNLLCPCADSTIFSNIFHNVFIMNAFYGVITIKMECSTQLTFFSVHSPQYGNYETLAKSRLPEVFAGFLEHFLKQDKNILESLSYNTVKSLSRISPLLINAYAINDDIVLLLMDRFFNFAMQSSNRFPTSFE